MAPNTVKAYQQGFSKSIWPLDSPFRIMAYLDKVPNSDSSLKQWIAIANRIHDSRLWTRPDFNHILVRDFISSIKHRPASLRSNLQKKDTFTETDLRKIFECLKSNKYPTDKRNWSIIVIQLFGVRRASEVLNLRVKDIRIAEDTLLIRAISKKTDKREQGIFFKLPHSSIFDFDPVEVITSYILSLRSNSDLIFPSYDPQNKKFVKVPTSVNAWNRALKRICIRAKVEITTSHAIRRSAISLSPIELVEAVAQTGGWKSLCFWEVYRRFDINQRAHAVSQIGKRKELTKENKFIIL